MRYRDITADRFRLPESHPVVATITIDPVDWFRFQRFDEDNPATRIVGHDEPRDGKLTVYVGCSSIAVRDRLENGWG